MASKRQWMKALLAVVLFAVMVPGRIVLAQDKPETDPKAERAVDKALSQTEKEKGKQEEKAGGEADAIRHSPSVNFIARKTGLSNDVVYWICIGLNFAVIFLGIA